MIDAPIYEMTISINVLNHLGINLYSNIPAVISEIVANAWDADAENVNIDIDTEKETITVTDDGHGMSEKDCNNKFLKVGYDRRQMGEIKTHSGRHVMGRKGIGKLSMFAIANVIEVQSVKKDEEGKIQKCGFIMNSVDIKNAIEGENKENGRAKYNPISIDVNTINFSKGTKIILSDLKKDISKLEIFLRKRLARRFSIIGKEHRFIVSVNRKEISVEDRDYFGKLDYIWLIGKNSDRVIESAENIKRKPSMIDGTVDNEKGYKVNGWIGTIDEQKNIDEGNNTIAVLAWGKLVHEDILKDVKETGVYAKYLIGEIQADFLDDDDKDDIVTSARQSVKENDPRFEILKDFVQAKILKDIQNKWGTWRKEDAKDDAIKNPKIKEWYESLSPDKKKYAEQLFQKIGSFPIQDPTYKKEIYKFGILAFERLSLKDSLSELSNLNSIDELRFASVFNKIDDIEATLYHEITTERLSVIEKFENIVDDDQKEKVLQKYIFDHLWLLHPSWERATSGEKRLEESVTKEFDAITANLTDEEKKARIDIRYRTAAGKHIIIELKRVSRKVKIVALHEQLVKYKQALEKCLAKHDRGNEPIEMICILGAPLEERYPNEIKILENINARIIYYEHLIAESILSYKDYIDRQPELSRINKLVDSI
jgi:hypothetical protein